MSKYESQLTSNEEKVDTDDRKSLWIWGLEGLHCLVLQTSWFAGNSNYLEEIGPRVLFFFLKYLILFNCQWVFMCICVFFFNCLYWGKFRLIEKFQQQYKEFLYPFIASCYFTYFYHSLCVPIHTHFFLNRLRLSFWHIVSLPLNTTLFVS